MRSDHRPYLAKKLQAKFEVFWVEHFIRPQLDSLGLDYMVMKPWYFKPHGKNIHLGQAIHIIAAADRTVRLTTWEHQNGAGAIHVDDYALLCPGTRIDSASEVRIGKNTMLAAGVYITDADWHGIYNRTQPVGNTQPVVLEDNSWVGDGSIVCKGVTIGENSIVGAGSVVTKSVPPNVIVAGNPAKVVRKLDVSQGFTMRSSWLNPSSKIPHQLQELERSMLRENSWLSWVRTIIAPKAGD